MQKLIEGVHQFQTKSFAPLQGLFKQLAKGQHPETLFITCSDSRINPTLLTRAEPGDLFILRNAGNIVPPHGAGNGGEAATIEFAVAAPGVKDTSSADTPTAGRCRACSSPSRSPRSLRVRGDLHLHGWVYKIETSEVFAYDVGEGQFVMLAEYHHPQLDAGVRRRTTHVI